MLATKVPPFTLGRKGGVGTVWVYGNVGKAD